MSAISRRLLIVGVVVAVLLGVTAAGALTVRMLWRTATSSQSAQQCQTGSYTLGTDQASVASMMVGVVIRRGLPERAAVLVLAAGLQESKLENVPSGAGDRDSVGVLQQRPSQGWGTIAQLMDVHYATGKFLDALLQVPDWSTLPAAVAIQDVQISADGDAYAAHEPQAQAIADALTGVDPAGVSCRFSTPSTVASPPQVAAQVSTDLPVNPPSTSEHAVTVPGASWATAAWFVANAERFGIEKVAFAQRSWSRTKGWRVDQTAASTAVVATMHT